MECLDCTGLSCPQPVIDTKNRLDAHPDTAGICVTVDNPAAAENVSRFLRSRGFETRIDGRSPRLTVTGVGTGTAPAEAAPAPRPADRNTLVMITRNTLGGDDKTLGAALMVNFIKTLPEIRDSLWRLIFVNEGVKLTIGGSDTLPVLEQLEKDGISILVCGTCLDYFKLLDQKQVGETTNMLDIITSLQVAAKVIQL
ncbi:sulfurtransferase-like selenium metabolism protein YedF [Desulfatiferula olefinivorans]